ncbi:MAG: 2,3-bisphosphoglycerate-independent phosphoglycerate mutase [Candidatus Kerfeldbacteria bacterium]|nr:2,3-bisphosphoglycerate-independent phosphoglycerate mutase [Candidatus Kerfeldbacteria bacterium]
MSNVRLKPIVLVILDGWGVAPASPGNAIALAHKPVWDSLIANYPTCTLQAAGEAVGLPWGEMGNSEVGHLNLGAGKIVYQDLPRVNKAIIDGSFFTNAKLVAAAKMARERNSRLHLIGLVSSGGVHSSIDHLYALLDLARQVGLPQVYIHAILDGRDTAFNTAGGYIKDLEVKLKKLKFGQIATVCGRFYAMDRDNHWDRIKAAYEAMVNGIGKPATSPVDAIKASYEARVFDEELVPTVINDSAGQPRATISDQDVVILFNFRADRMRQLTRALVVPDFAKFTVKTWPQLQVVTMTEYDKNLPVEVAFPPEAIAYPLARVVADAGLKQLHLAETEKYAHVTYFFNGGHEQPYPGEDHVLVPSPVVPSYEQKPEMSARGLTDRFLQEVRTGKYDFVLMNFANADMVAHTGNLPATVKAVEFLDQCLGEIVASTLEFGGMVLLTADHGNAEGLVNHQTGEIDKEHSNLPVPFLMISRDLEHKAISGLPQVSDLSQLAPSGVLADVAPTILKVMGLPKPVEMTGQSLL